MIKCLDPLAAPCLPLLHGFWWPLLDGIRGVLTLTLPQGSKHVNNTYFEAKRIDVVITYFGLFGSPGLVGGC